MRGQPVWLASLTRWQGSPRHSTPRTTGTWTPGELADGFARLRVLLDGVGDPERERGFRMNLTLCIHRATTPDEAARLPPFTPSHLAGGPVEVVYETEPGKLSTRPCSDPGREVFGGTWLPVDCGRCATCLARAGVAGHA